MRNYISCKKTATPWCVSLFFLNFAAESDYNKRLLAMKRICRLFVTALILWASTLSVRAQGNNFPFVKQFEYGYFNHLGVGVSLGFDGIGFDVAAPVGNYLGLRAGVSFFPKLSFERNFELNDDDPDITDNVDVKGTLNIFDFKVLADIYPFNSGFHLTVGAYIGSENVFKAHNTSMFLKNPADYGRKGLMIGDYRVTTDEHGYANANVVVKSFKPYVGIGFGRAVPKSRLDFSFDFGVKFWGKPALGAETLNDWGEKEYHKIHYSDLNEDDDEDFRDGMKIAEKVIGMPVLTLRLSGRIL